MSDNKILLVTQSMAIEAAETLKEIDQWSNFEMVIVRDEDYEALCADAKSILPKGKCMSALSLEELKSINQA